MENNNETTPDQLTLHQVPAAVVNVLETIEGIEVSDKGPNGSRVVIPVSELDPAYSGLNLLIGQLSSIANDINEARSSLAGR